jgi:hypothetical protein
MPFKTFTELRFLCSMNQLRSYISTATDLTWISLPMRKYRQRLLDHRKVTERFKDPLLFTSTWICKASVPAEWLLTDGYLS